MPRLAGVEACFERAGDHFNRFVRFLISGSDSSSFDYVIGLEYQSRVRSRVRSYKGVFQDRSGASAADRASFRLHGDLDRVSVEVAVDGDYTHLVGLIRPTRENAKDCLSWLTDSSRSFAVSSPSDIFTPEEL